MKPFFQQNNNFVKSLKTSNIATANKYAKILLNKIHYIKQSIKMAIDSNEIKKLVEDLTNTTFNETEATLYNTDNVEDTVFALTLENTIKSYKNDYSAENYAIVEKEAKNILKSLNLKYSESKFNEISKLLLEAHINNLKIIFDKIDSGAYYKPKTVSTLSAPLATGGKNVPIEEGYDKFEKHFEEDWSEDTKNANRNYFNFFIKYVGNGRLTNTLSMRDFEDFKGELAKVKATSKSEKKNIKQKDNIWTVKVELTEDKDTKNVHRIRTVPLHLKLIELGFLDFVNKSKAGMLFHVDNKEFSREMTNVNRKHVSTNPKRTFNRLRANFINCLLQKGIQNDHVAGLVGHSPEYGIAYGSYANKLGVGLLAETLKHIDYKF